MTIKWNEYTWYSRLSALIFFLGILPTLTFYIGTQYQETKDVINYANISMANELPLSPRSFTETPINNSGSTTTTPIGSISSSTSATTTPVTITQADDRKTVDLKVGQSFILKLGNMSWNTTVSDPSIISAGPIVPEPLGVQGTYIAKKVGTTMLESQGRPICNDGEMCAQYIVDFQVTLNVTK